MRNLVLMAAVLVAAWTAEQPARAEPPNIVAFFSVEKLEEFCSSGPEPGHDPMCFMYIAGVADMTDNAQFGHHPYFCRPPGITVMQLTQSVIGFFHEHPQFRPYGAAGGVFAALMTTYPCAPAAPDAAPPKP